MYMEGLLKNKSPWPGQHHEDMKLELGMGMIHSGLIYAAVFQI
jgi:hypothetical protein